MNAFECPLRVIRVDSGLSSATSAIHPIASEQRTSTDVRKVPEADIGLPLDEMKEANRNGLPDNILEQRDLADFVARTVGHQNLQLGGTHLIFGKVASDHCGFFESGLVAGKFLSLFSGDAFAVLDMEKIARHDPTTTAKAQRSCVGSMT